MMQNHEKHNEKITKIAIIRDFMRKGKTDVCVSVRIIKKKLSFVPKRSSTSVLSTLIIETQISSLC